MRISLCCAAMLLALPGWAEEPTATQLDAICGRYDPGQPTERLNKSERDDYMQAFETYFRCSIMVLLMGAATHPPPADLNPRQTR